jgi:hypothetical protein
MDQTVMPAMTTAIRASFGTRWPAMSWRYTVHRRPAAIPSAST